MKRTWEISAGCYFKSRFLGKCALSRWHLLQLTLKGGGVGPTKIRGCGWPLMIHQIVLCSICSWKVTVGWIAHIGVSRVAHPGLGRYWEWSALMGRILSLTLLQIECIIKSRLTFSQFTMILKFFTGNAPVVGWMTAPQKMCSCPKPWNLQTSIL